MTGVDAEVNLLLAWRHACLGMVCTKCGHHIPPAEIRRIDFETVRCPACGEKFVPRGRVLGGTSS
jgi:predicted RNA-binding Zn-ribbon protein involved in translation (DUF1610 family)